MINRLLIRIKTVQLLYAYMQGSLDKLNRDEQMATAVESSYKLYNYLLALVVKLTEYRQSQIDAARNKFMPTDEERFPNLRFVNNSVAKFISEKSEIIDYCNKNSLLSDFDTETYRALLTQIEQMPAYNQFMTQKETPSFEQEKALWRDIFAEVITRSPILDATLEEKSIFWNDDLSTVTQFVVRTINQMQPDDEMIKVSGMYDRKEDSKFARELFHHALDEAHANLDLIDRNAENWQIDRMALMDKVVMCCALSEIRNFPDIAVRISMNEYIELAKHYCAPESSRFVNGILDKIVKQWKQEGMVFKA
ncbi:MAG: transcription antitermination protein NusB [Bacteroidales bacterium]|nr:transcription antitermination protein NusB [Candidatus Liminaster caballi]